MKKQKMICLVLMFLPLAVTVFLIGFLPDQIPLHYGFDGQADRWGSKYESFIFPVTTILMGLFMLWMSRIAARQEKNGENNARVVLLTGILLLVWFNVMNGYTLYTSFLKVEDLSAVKLDMNSLVCLFTGLILVLVGNVMPKLRMNSLIGLRTSWSMKNETVWKKSQRFGGISFIVSGVLMIVAGIWIRGMAGILWMLAILIADVIVCVYYTYRAARADG